MRLSPTTISLISLGYICMLFGVAYWAERRKDRGRSLISNPYVYALSLAVYCTSWTFYGSVGLAATRGMNFLAIYLGPTLVAFSWWILLRKMVRVTQENHITSISDFIAFRYGNSGKIGALVAVMMLVGITPYIGLQLKAISLTFDLLTHGSGGDGEIFGRFAGDGSLWTDTAFIAALVLGVFGGMFGARELDPSERHEGMVAAIAVESVVKLFALLLVGVFVTWGVFNGFGDIFARIASYPEFAPLIQLGPEGGSGYAGWLTLLILSGVSVMLLPRQFHVMVVENCDESHITKAMWLFPLYLLLINLFVIPIAYGGLLLIGSADLGDAFVLLIPLRMDHPTIALIAFIGGFSAATGMVIVSSVALSTMLLNNLCMPLVLRLRWLKPSAVLIHLKRAGIVLIILVGYLYYLALGETMILVNMGLISFGAATQLAPAVFGGLFWRQATARGAAVGLSLGFATWFYMFLTPSLCLAGWLPQIWLTEGPLGVSLLRPTAFLGLEGLDVWSHGLFWTSLLNGGGFALTSVFTSASRMEMEQVARFVFAERGAQTREPEFRLAKAPPVGEFELLLAKFIGPKKARQRMRSFFGGDKYEATDKVSDRTLVKLRQFVEKQLGGVVGTAGASAVVERYLSLKGTRMEEVFDVFGELSLSLEESRGELESRVRELSVLFEAAKRISATLDETEAVDAVLDLLETDFGLRYQGVFFYDGLKVTPGPLKGVSRRLAERLTGPPDPRYCVARTAMEGLTHNTTSEHVERGDYAELSARYGLKSIIATPIRHENVVLGVLFAGSGERGGYFSDKFVETFEALASELALAVANARLFAEVHNLNRTLEEKVRERTAELHAAMTHLRQLDQMKSQFLANMSHELRTPMNSILGYTQLVLDEVDGPVTGDQRASLARVEKNARHLLQLINDLLDLSKIEAGKMTLEFLPVELGTVAAEVVEDLRPQAEAKGLYVRAEVEPGDLTVFADPLKVREVLNNLVGNGIKFTDNGGVTVIVATGEHTGRDGVLLAVADTGVGIPAESLETVFEAFKQLDGSTTRAHGGTGLGLNIARKLVEMHGGRLTVGSELGKGAVFRVWLPRVQMERTEHDDESVAGPDAAHPDGPSGKDNRQE